MSHCAPVHKGQYNMPVEAVMKISNLKQDYETKHRNFEETFPQNFRGKHNTNKCTEIISSCKQDS